LRDSPKKAVELLETSNLSCAILEELRLKALCSTPTKSPSVSVCVPTYNGREHLRECIDSIRAQSFKNLEVVICDDQSSDGTLDYARELAQGDDRFRFISNPSRFGLVGNWNNCIRAARGEWIKFVFQDDLIAPQCVEKLLQACRQSGKPFAFCARELIIEDGVSPVCQTLKAHQAEIEEMYRNISLIANNQVIQIALQRPTHNIVGEPTTTLIQKSAFEQVGLFDEAMIQLCDTEFWFRIMSNFGGFWVPERLATFRVHTKATTTANQKQRAYRSEVLDPLIIVYRFAFDRHFAALRAVKLPGKSKFGLRKQCASLAYYARQQAQRNPKRENSPGIDQMKEWNAIVLSYPALRWLASVGEAIELCGLLKSAARKMFKFRRFGLGG
jgi:glycosyltransferase involved in cell wall biosynthesis